MENSYATIKDTSSFHIIQAVMTSQFYVFSIPMFSLSYKPKVPYKARLMGFLWVIRAEWVGPGGAWFGSEHHASTPPSLYTTFTLGSGLDAHIASSHLIFFHLKRITSKPSASYPGNGIPPKPNHLLSMNGFLVCERKTWGQKGPSVWELRQRCTMRHMRLAEFR